MQSLPLLTEDDLIDLGMTNPSERHTLLANTGRVPLEVLNDATNVEAGARERRRQARKAAKRARRAELELAIALSASLVDAPLSEVPLEAALPENRVCPAQQGSVAEYHGRCPAQQERAAEYRGRPDGRRDSQAVQERPAEGPQNDGLAVLASQEAGPGIAAQIWLTGRNTGGCLGEVPRQVPSFLSDSLKHAHAHAPHFGQAVQEGRAQARERLLLCREPTLVSSSGQPTGLSRSGCGQPTVRSQPGQVPKEVDTTCSSRGAGGQAASSASGQSTWESVGKAREPASHCCPGNLGDLGRPGLPRIPNAEDTGGVPHAQDLFRIPQDAARNPQVEGSGGFRAVTVENTRPKGTGLLLGGQALRERDAGSAAATSVSTSSLRAVEAQPGPRRVLTGCRRMETELLDKLYPAAQPTVGCLLWFPTVIINM